MAETTSSNTDPGTTTSATPVAGEKITAADMSHLMQMMLDLQSHTHTFTDDYTSDCNCNCGRGTM